jgi:23S rRNA (uridine2552-2'-O)-methyltransferase
VAVRFLKRGGNFIVKLFHSEEFEGYRKKLREQFDQVEIIRPKSTRKESKEIFLVGVKFKGRTE